MSREIIYEGWLYAIKAYLCMKKVTNQKQNHPFLIREKDDPENNKSFNLFFIIFPYIFDILCRT